MEKEITIIEISADSLYLIIVGDKKAIDKLAEMLIEKELNIDYISVKIDTPSIAKCNELSELYGKYVKPSMGMETAQCYAYAEGFSNNTHILMAVDKSGLEYSLGFPKFDLSEDTDPEKIIYDWMKKKMGKIPKSIKKTMKPITLVGNKDDILVFVSKYSIE